MEATGWRPLGAPTLWLTPLAPLPLRGGSIRCLELLLKDRATLGIRNEKGWTELHQACRYGREAHVEMLLLFGADPNETNVTGSTPFRVCGTWDQGKCARVLLKVGANREAVNRAGQTAYQVAMLAGSTDVARALNAWSDRAVEPVGQSPQ